MRPADAVVRGLEAAGVDLVAYVPCGQARELFPELDRRFETLRVTREEEGVGVLAGAALTGSRCVLVTQSSGLGNSVNALTTLHEAYGIPLAVIVSHRGAEGDWNPAQLPQGRRTRALLKSLEIPFAEPLGPDVEPATRAAVEDAFHERTVRAVLLRSELFGEGST